jgi:hypothetical protein
MILARTLLVGIYTARIICVKNRQEIKPDREQSMCRRCQWTIIDGGKKKKKREKRGKQKVKVYAAE